MAELEPGRASALVSAAAAVAELTTGDLTSSPSPNPLHLPSQSSRAPADRGFWIHAALELGRRHGALLLHIHAKGGDERGGSHRFLPALSPGRPPPSQPATARPKVTGCVTGCHGTDGDDDRRGAHIHGTGRRHGDGAPSPRIYFFRSCSSKVDAIPP